VQQQMERDYAVASRLRLKRALLDKLAERYDFAVPPGMVELEFNNIWAQHQAEQELQGGRGGDAGAEAAPVSGGAATEAAAVAPSSEGEPAAGAETAGAEAEIVAEGGEESLKGEYNQIAERRVRLGLLLAEVGRSNNITVTQEEINQAITREVRRHPGYERQALDFYRQNPEAVANLRAPIFEDKVVDFIVELAKVDERRVTPQELLALPDPDAETAVTAGSPAGASPESADPS
jgi:trigger factor